MVTPVEAIYPLVGRQIQVARDRQGISQASLGRQLTPPLKRASIANIEAGKQRILLHTLIGIAATLKMPPEQLLPMLQSTDPEKAAQSDSNLQSELIRLMPQRSVTRLLKSLKKEQPHESTISKERGRETRRRALKRNPANQA
jgi:transcriptional regulator with XRE-family HTH domain